MGASTVVAESGAFVGANVAFLSGVRIGSQSFVAAGSVAAGLPPRTLVAGVSAPAARPVGLNEGLAENPPVERGLPLDPQQGEEGGRDVHETSRLGRLVHRSTRALGLHQDHGPQPGGILRHQAAVADHLARAVVAVDEDDGAIQAAQATQRLQETLQEQEGALGLLREVGRLRGAEPGCSRRGGR